jgi:hypothetical protein
MNDDHPLKVVLIIYQVLLEWLIPTADSDHQPASLDLAAHSLVTNQVQFVLDMYDRNRDIVLLDNYSDHGVNIISLFVFESYRRGLEQLFALLVDLVF